jgi:hypothetical protein
MQNLRPEFVENAMSKIEKLESGDCLIMKGNELLTKKAYLESWRRAFGFAVNNNAARLALKLSSRNPSASLTSLSPIEQRNPGS